MNYDNQRINPRFNRYFTVTLILGGDLRFHGRAVEPSAFGCNVEVTEYQYNQLKAHPALWEQNRRITVSTNLNEIPAQINKLKENEHGKFLVSIKLLDGRTWYH